MKRNIDSDAAKVEAEEASLFKESCLDSGQMSRREKQHLQSLFQAYEENDLVKPDTRDGFGARRGELELSDCQLSSRTYSLDYVYDSRKTLE